MAKNWQSLVDRLLQDAQERGTFDNLTGHGKKLRLEDDPYTPDDLRLAHKILKEHDLAPEWILLRKDIEALWRRLENHLAQGWRAYQGGLADAERSATPFERRQKVEATWQRALIAYRTQAAKLNGEILRYNLKVPPGIPQKALFDLERALEKLPK
jgi:hypothetical protein